MTTASIATARAIHIYRDGELVRIWPALLTPAAAAGFVQTFNRISGPDGLTAVAVTHRYVLDPLPVARSA